MIKLIVRHSFIVILMEIEVESWKALALLSMCTRTHIVLYLSECVSWALGRGRTTDVCSLQETFRLSPVKRKKKKRKAQGFYHKCFIISLRGGLARSLLSVTVCVRECACWSSRTPAVLWQPVLVSQLVSVFVLGRCPCPINHSLCLIYVSLTTI